VIDSTYGFARHPRSQDKSNLGNSDHKGFDDCHQRFRQCKLTNPNDNYFDLRSFQGTRTSWNISRRFANILLELNTTDRKNNETTFKKFVKQIRDRRLTLRLD
jgi:hypothetical protein